MNAATFFGRQYVEATRKPGTRRRHHQDEGEDESRHAKMGMRPLGDQTEDDSEGGGAQWTCESCGESNPLKLPKGVALAEDEQEDEDEAAGRPRFVSARCSSCRAPHKVEAPTGFRYAKTEEAAQAFSRGYRRIWRVREAAIRHGHLSGAMTVR